MAPGEVIWDLRKEQDSEEEITALVGYSQLSLGEKEEFFQFPRHRRLILWQHCPEGIAQGVGYIIDLDLGTKQQ